MLLWLQDISLILFFLWGHSLVFTLMCSDLCCSSTLAPPLSFSSALSLSLSHLCGVWGGSTGCATCFFYLSSLVPCDHVCDCRPKFIGSFDNLVGRSLATRVPSSVYKSPTPYCDQTDLYSPVLSATWHMNKTINSPVVYYYRCIYSVDLTQKHATVVLQ